MLQCMIYPFPYFFLIEYPTSVLCPQDLRFDQIKIPSQKTVSNSKFDSSFVIFVLAKPGFYYLSNFRRANRQKVLPNWTSYSAKRFNL